MPSQTSHHNGGTREGKDACFAAIRKLIAKQGHCSEADARGIALSMFPAPVLVRIGAKKAQYRRLGGGGRFAEEVDAFLNGSSVSTEAVEWFRYVGGSRQLTRLKEAAKSGAIAGITYDKDRKEFVPS
jgi:hypothetical protein